MKNANNIIDLDRYRKKPRKDIPVQKGAGIDTLVSDGNDNWTFLHKSDYEDKVQQLVDEGVIKAGRVEINDTGIPTVYITLYDHYDQDVECYIDPDITPGANNP